MMLKRVKALKFFIRRVSELDLLRLSSLFLKVVREQGLMTAARKAWRMLFWDQGVNYLDQVQQWYELNNCAAVSSPAEQIFSSPNVLIVGTLDLPQCKKYRVFQKIELMQQMGYNCDVSDYRDIPRVFNKLQLATLVIFYRIPDDDLFRLFMKEAERLKIRTGYDIDDPIFAPDVYAENKNLDTLTNEEKKQLLVSSPRYSDAMKKCEFVSVSTPGMRELSSTCFDGPIILWRNVLDGETLSIVAGLDQPVNSDPDSDKIVIAYMSGSRAHDADFSTIEQTLSGILADYPNVQLMICGYANITGALQPHTDQIKQFSFSGYAGYFNHLGQADICVIPLLQDRFNECKSAIRYLEAAVLGVPTIASNIGDFRNLIVSGENGVLAETADEWDAALRKMITDRKFRAKLSDNSRSFVMEKQTVKALSNSMQHEFSYLLYGAEK